MRKLPFIGVHKCLMLMTCAYFILPSPLNHSILSQLGNHDPAELEKYSKDLRKALEAEKLASVATVLPITPWGHFINALNAAVSKAVEGEFEIIAFQVTSCAFYLETGPLAPRLHYPPTSDSRFLPATSYSFQSPLCDTPTAHFRSLWSSESAPNQSVVCYRI
jgi:hypothetical protein